MEYKKYIDLGFKRTDLNCGVEFNRTGYGGFCLEKKINDIQFIGVNSNQLEKPMLYIKKRNQEKYHLIPISCEAVIDLCEGVSIENGFHGDPNCGFMAG